MLTHQPAVAHTADGQSIDAYTLVAGTTRVRILTRGGIITHLFTPDRNGVAGDIVLGFDRDADYLKENPYFGAIIGRYANRIARGRFTLDGIQSTLVTNNGANHLHGGTIGYDKRLWNAEPIDDHNAPALRLSLRDADGMDGYPGNVDVVVTYTLRDGVLRIEYEAQTDRPTPINLTNHSYFNLRDAGKTPIVDHELLMEADSYLPVDAGLIPTGDIKPVKGTPIDFTNAKPIGSDLAAMGGTPAGFDHCVVLRQPSTFRHAATAFDPTTGRTLACWTSEPALQLYSGNFLDGTLIGKGGSVYERYHGFCLETQHYPDAPNQTNFPTTILRPGETYRTATEYRFGIADRG